MVTFKNTFGPRRRSDGTYPVRIRITHQRKVGYISTPYSVKSSALNKNGELLNNEKNNQLLHELNKRIEDYINRLPFLGNLLNNMQVKVLCNELAKPVNTEEVNLLSYFERKIQDFAHTRSPGTIAGYHAALNRLKMFLGKETLFPSEFNVKLLNDFEINMRTVLPTLNDVRKKKTVSNSGIRLYTAYLSSLCKIAEQEDVLAVNPYRKGYLKVSQNFPEKRNLDIEILRKIANAETVGRMEYVAQNVAMISYMLCGMNTADLFYCPRSKTNRITYERRKTRAHRNDKALTSVLIQPELKKYLDRHADHERQFDFHRLYANQGQFNKQVNKGLRHLCNRLEINPVVTSYWFRHTWATIARNELHIPKDDIHFALNHSSASNITDAYLAVDFSIIDRCNRQVLNFLYQKPQNIQE